VTSEFELFYPDRCPNTVFSPGWYMVFTDSKDYSIADTAHTDYENTNMIVFY